MNPKKQVALFTAAVYFIQGAIGISAVAVPIYFRKLGWSIADITLISSLVSLPWVFKVFYGFLSDSFPWAGYRRKSYLFFYLLCSCLGWVGFAFWGHTQTIILFSLLIANLGFAGTDVITDGLVVENSDGEWSRIYQSIAWGARSFGAVLTGALGGWLVLHFEPKIIFCLTAALPLIALLPLLLFHEEVNICPFSATDFILKAKAVGRFCIDRKHWLFVLFFSLSSSSVLFGTPFFFHMKEKLLFREDYLGFLISLGWVGAAIGSMVFMLRMKKMSIRNLFYVVVILNVLNVLSTFGVRSVDSAAWLVFFGGIAGGMTILPLMTGAALITSKSGVEGTLFALLMGLYNLSQIAWAFLGAKLLPVLGLGWLIGLAALIQAVGLLLIPFDAGVSVFRNVFNATDSSQLI